ncbi:MAG: T9SS type A sorting domain-containing protein [candidate division KSB1 bacterium]|nr:T9SS type A sorting domain-containing protein [candidate division KSB1 bacterium]
MVNFSDEPVTTEGHTLSAKGFFATNGDERVYRIRSESGAALAAAELRDRLFIQPQAFTAELHGVRTAGSVLLRKRDSDILMTLIGDQAYVDICAAELPWPLENIQVSGVYSSISPDVETLANGYHRISKTETEMFYRLQGDFNSAVQSPENGNSDLMLNVSPNPFNPQTVIGYILDSPQHISLRIYNILGQQVAILVDARRRVGVHKVTWDGCDSQGHQLGAGLYLVELAAGTRRRTQKILLMK